MMREISMNRLDWDIVCSKLCIRCNGYYSHMFESHPIDDCDLEIARDITER